MDKTILMAYLKQLESRMMESVVEIDKWSWRSAIYINPGQYHYDHEWQPVTGHELFPQKRTIFLRTVFDCPSNLILKGDQQDYLFFHVTNLEGYLRVNGNVYHGLDRNRDRIPLQPEWLGSKLVLEMELFSHNTHISSQDQPWFAYTRIGRVNKKIESFYYDLKLAFDTYYLDEALVSRFSRNLDTAQRALNHAQKGYVKPYLMRAMDCALQNLDLSLSQDDFLASIDQAAQILSEQIRKINDGHTKGLVSLIGHTHIDVAWLWQLKDTVRKCGHSFANMLRIMEEYPEYTFSCSQPQLYAYTKEYYPELYKQIKTKIADGHWELVGPMWVESDCNVVSGESLVRQLLHGHHFLMDEFGSSSNICWLPDTFGFQPNMPQILKKSGVDYFFSYKLHWQAHNRFPYGSFRWRGIDGSEVIASVPELVSGYNGDPVPAQLRYAQDANLQKDVIDDVIFPYGWGDGGGGPTRNMIEYARRLSQYPSLPDSRMVTASQFFAGLQKKAELLPVWHGELALETHRGTFTTQGSIKRANRFCEILLQTAEKLAVFSGLRKIEDVRNKLQEAWQIILLLQFHDILPGSSIHEVYTDALPMYEKVMSMGNYLVERALNRIGGPSNENGTVLMVYNPLSWDRSEIVHAWVACADDESISLRSTDDEVIDVIEEAREAERVSIRFKANVVPSIGYKLFHIVREKGNQIRDITGASVISTSEGMRVESSRYIMIIKSSGHITRLYDKLARREIIENIGNELLLFHDGPQGEDAWNLYEEYIHRPYHVNWQDTLHLIENNMLRTVLLLNKRTMNSNLEEKIIMDHVSNRIDFILKTDWQEQHKLLKVGFELGVHAPYALCDTGFGSYNRPTVANNPYEKEKFEVVAHKWVDLSEGNYGVAILNDSKYGHRIVDNRVEISLLRSTTSPDDQADRGQHQIGYSLFPHQGDWRKALTARQGFAYNTPLICHVIADDHITDRSGTPFLSLSTEDLVIDTIKPAWDGHGVIIRIHETMGNHGSAVLHSTNKIMSSEETDLIEQKSMKQDVEENSIHFTYAPYEIKTYRLVYEDTE